MIRVWRKRRRTSWRRRSNCEGGEEEEEEEQLEIRDHRGEGGGRRKRSE